MNSPLISIIIPIYNMEKLLPRCLDSILRQTYTTLEIILVNDGSQDSSADICNEYAQKDSRFKVIHKQNAGVSAARNSALDIASGEYISFVDSDDWLEDNMYQILIANINQETTDIIRFNAYKEKNILNKTHLKGNYEGENMVDNVILPMIGAEKLFGMFLMGVPWTYLFRRNIIEQNNIRFNINLRRSEDRLFCITTMLHADKITFIDDVLYHYETLGESLSNRYDPIRWEQELLFLDELKKEYTKVLPPEKAQEANNRIKTDYLLRAIVSINNIFFSNNNNSFTNKYKRTKQIVSDKHVRESVKGLKKEKTNLKESILFCCIKNHLSLSLSIFQYLLLLKNKI